MAVWTMNLKEYVKKVEDDLDTARKKIAFQLYCGVVQKTPVDTGRARGNWQIGINSCPTGTIDEVDKQAVGSSPANTEQINSKLESVQKDDTIYITNNLPYILALEHGSSTQAPNGMVELTMMEVKSRIDSVVGGGH